MLKTAFLSKIDFVRLVPAAIPLLTAVMSILFYLADPDLLQTLRNFSFDQYQQWAPREYRPAPVRVIDIDDESLARLGQWPWPRTQLAKLVQKLNAAEPAAIVFDVIFPEPDRTSPDSMLETWGRPPGLDKALNALPDHDQAFAHAVARAPVVLGHALQAQGDPRAPDPAARLASPFRMIVAGASPAHFLHGFQGSLATLPLLQQAAAGVGSVNYIPDADGIVRRVLLFSTLGKQILPSLDAEALRVAQGERNYLLKTSPAAGLEFVRVGRLHIPTTARGEVWLHYSPRVAERTIPVWKILADETPAASLRGHILLVGASAPGLMDLRFSPLGGAVPGVEIHAQALEQMLAGESLARPGWTSGFEMALLAVAALIAGWVALAASAAVSAAFAGLLGLLMLFGGWVAFARYGLLVDVVTPGLALVTSFSLSSVYRHMTTERRQRWVKQAFSRYVSPNLVSYLVDHPDSLQLGGRRQECSFIFTDLAGFTTLMEKIDPTQAVGLLNKYLDEMIAIAFRHEGTLDRIVGDAVAVIFSAPIEQPDHRQRAYRCALEMREFSNRYMAEANAGGFAFGMTRIGVHTGEVTVGNFGGSTIFDYRALGDPINTAARLESVNKQLGTQMCVSEATLSGCSDAIARPVGRLVLKGKREALMVYEPQAHPDPEYQSAYHLMETGSETAGAAFLSLSAKRPDDPLVKFHLARLANGPATAVIIFAEK